ncbi:gamma-glutamyltranspeptidase : Gamma-glutamyltransferase OS=Planctomyces brasiliensis (strain ATCC 49424 / DSM 5305 / JCM 21570 / NBRC 103401 / IFAM 1448) GN=Plabr_4283 PE=4 SV=1: G_glu_transpept [Gemmataceae bacterium]|nr:gamma-glutamyltranspeptidase : Gamma-glutamyltransferase OS=Planctomyces brasiliensis (strain ATCC 49424 / DSM 5305 / JCM 21570 / NBRC 103401 / IFAM 1448) GN=Plabr_4283 PE=4 SV=1: G_glu_transpept [Gemmataceae bacterium]VTT98338.1 gamma-glutamyltranspeptidase : Gamma-glutamyltransferase OS=Planctomyces brasiliensis (strain ATCC 49424 / DSM 5305 / JCM 21570 / NBRC 103401 / IFAM 1448) GN=Plabr_4283 PE=4 SV=1: G_glu_transpept [Gemmataceae bacterium]
MRHMLLALTVTVLALPSAAQPPKAEAVESKGGVVVCVSPPAADVGLVVLKTGGNAVDAAVAVAFAMAVTWPEAGNVGGGGFMMVAPPGKEVRCIEYRETAPAAAKVDLFADGTVTPLDHKAAGVPGTVRGLALAHQKYGRLPWADVVRPAVKLAEDGFTVNAVLARGLNNVLADAKTTNAEFRRVYGRPNKEEWTAGEKLVLPDLAKTLRAIAEKGPDAFYTGDPADLLVKEMKAHGGLITKADLAAYKANDREPVRTTYRGFDVYGPPPPSAGGLCVAQVLGVLENYDLKKLGRWSPEANHLIIEAMKFTYADRARSLGDPDFVKIPQTFRDREYAKKIAARIDPKRATPSLKVAPDLVIDKESDSTTHFSVIDKDGMAVSNTYTLENSYGNRVVVPGAGYILNNEMTDFNPRPGWTTSAGQIGTKPNRIEPGRRMLSSQTPVVVLNDGKVVLVTGSPGGRTITNTVLCVLVNVLDFDMPLPDAVAAPRMHHQWLPDAVRFEGVKQHPELVAALKELGHTVAEARQGDAHSIAIDPKTGVRTGVADKRLDGKAAGE